MILFRSCTLIVLCYSYYIVSSTLLVFLLGTTCYSSSFMWVAIIALGWLIIVVTDCYVQFSVFDSTANLPTLIGVELEK